ncbi:MAG TPA: response regulator [Bacillota bacterium]|nr:response regulator [Bacillota bacterium]
MKKVLVVDDTKNIRNLLTTCLEVEGYQVFTATDGKEALEMIRRERYDLIFLDIKLPEVSGTEVLRKIREGKIHTPVVIMTAFGTVRNAVECTRLGAVAYLQKPFTADKIRNTLAEISDVYAHARLSNDPASYHFFLNEARQFMGAEKYEEAFEKCKQALAMDPGQGEIYYLIGRIYEAQANSQEANRYYKIAEQFRD